MLTTILNVALIIAVGVTIASTVYLLFAMWRVGQFARRPLARATSHEPVSVLIPIAGLDAGLYDNLRSICRQDYPDYQVVLGLERASDPAIEVIRRIMNEFPDHDIALVVAQQGQEENLKIRNLAQMYPRAKHEILIMLDSDMRVTPNYLGSIVAPFQDPEVGLVTCLYKGSPGRGLSSRLASMYINEWFLPSVLVARAVSKTEICLGATMAVRRDILDSIGGFSRLASYLADDFMLGRLVSEQGYRVHVSSYVVENIIVERDLKALFHHELRWARTIRTVQPLGYAFSFIMYAVPVAGVTGILDEITTDSDIFEIGFVSVALFLRIALHYITRRALGDSSPPAPWLVPVRDLLSFVIWVAGFFGNDVVWRGRSFSVGRDGRLVAKS